MKGGGREGEGVWRAGGLCRKESKSKHAHEKRGWEKRGWAAHGS